MKVDLTACVTVELVCTILFFYIPLLLIRRCLRSKYRNASGVLFKDYLHARCQHCCALL